MTTLKLLQASAIAAVFAIGSSALAAEMNRTTEGATVKSQQNRTARAANPSGHASGPAQGTDVRPTTGQAAGGEPGKAGSRDTESGRAPKASKY
jgi:hypothetical protein